MQKILFKYRSNTVQISFRFQSDPMSNSLQKHNREHYGKRLESIIKKQLKLRVSLNQYCYIITILIAMSRYIDLEFYYITDGDKSFVEANYIELKKYNMFDEKNMFFMTLDDFASMVLRDFKLYKQAILYYVIDHNRVFGNKVSIGIAENFRINCGHGIDEEAYLLKKFYCNNRNDYFLYKEVSNISTVNGIDLIDDIYRIDKSKKTILVQDSINSFFFCIYDERVTPTLVKYQNRIINQLIKLKEKYNIIIRFHPQYYHGWIVGNNSVSTHVLRNFIVDYTQLSLHDLYKKSDIVITSRYTSSGFQALFELNKNMILIDNDIDTRQTNHYVKHWTVNNLKNNTLRTLMDENKIANESIAVISREDVVDLVEIVSSMEQNNFQISGKMIEDRKKFLVDKFNVDVDEDTSTSGIIMMDTCLEMLIYPSDLIINTREEIRNLLKD